MKVFFKMTCLTSGKSFVFGADPEYDPDPGILTEFLPHRGNCKNFVGSAAFAEV